MTAHTAAQAARITRALITDLRKVHESAVRRALDLSEFIDAIERALDEEETDPRAFTDVHFGLRIEEKIDDACYLHKGSSDAMHVRAAKRNLFHLIGDES